MGKKQSNPNPPKRRKRPKPPPPPPKVDKYLELIMNMGNDPDIAVYHNTPCLKCNAIEEYMVRIGALVFCQDCAKNTFQTDDPVTKERKVYLEYLEIYKKKCMED